MTDALLKQGVAKIICMEGHHQIRILGPLEVYVGDEVIDLGGPRHRRLLTALQIAAGRVVSADVLVERVFAESELPADPRRTLRTYIARLRNHLADPELIKTESMGYRLASELIDIDADQFEDLMHQATDPGQSSDARLRLLDAALALWRGPAYEPLQYEDWLRPEAHRLEELRLVALGDRLETMLELGQHAVAVGELDALVVEYPLRSRFVGLMMLALYRSGRQTEAGRAYDQHRSLLIDEVGLEPDPELVVLDRRIVTGDQSLAVSPAGRSIRGYQLAERLGEGSFAVVYRGTQPSVGREVAVKVIRPDLANRPEFIRRFETEANVVARIEHPHVVPLYDYWREPDRACLVFRYLRGGTLETHLDQHGPMTFARARMLAEQVGAALQAAHRLGVTHRDVRPANILLDEEANFYLGDFGIALEASTPIDHKTPTLVGSLAFAAPELDAAATGPHIDVYGLGATLTAALAGSGTPTDPLPDAARAALAKSTSPEPEERFHSVEEFVQSFCSASAQIGERHDERRGVLGAVANPYKGLRPFAEADASQFFGRETLIDHMVGLVAREGLAGRVLAVVGPSGIGKSSLVQAGLLPALKALTTEDSGPWFATTMHPGSDPSGEMVAALLRVADRVPDHLMRIASANDEGLSQIVRAMHSDTSAETVLVIDQFEELYTLSDELERARIIASIERAVRDENGRLRVILTLRADFWDRILLNGSFARLLESSTVHLSGLDPHELERAITAPARTVGAEFEPGLVADIVADVHDQPGSLPHLQFALTELYSMAPSGLLTRGDYQKLGGVPGAIARRAEEIFAALSPDEGKSARRLFERLVTINESGTITRRRATREEIGSASSLDSAIDRFGAARLLSFDHDRVSRTPTIELSHEALIDAWPRLAQWLAEDRAHLQTLQHLRRSAAAWEASGDDDGELYQGGRLETAAILLDADHFELTVSERRFLGASTARQLAMTEADRRSNQRLRRSLVAVAIVAAVALIASGLAWQQRSRAQATAVAADLRRMVADAAAVVDDDPTLALLLAVEANRRDPGPTTLAGLQRVLSSTGDYLGTVGSGVAYRQVEWSSIGIVGISDDAVDVYDSTDHTLQWSIALPAAVAPRQIFGAKIADRSGDRLAIALESGSVALVNLTDRTLDLLPGDSLVTAVAFDADGEMLALGDIDRTLRVVNFTNRREAWSVEAYWEDGPSDVELPDGIEFSKWHFEPWGIAQFFGSGVKALEWTSKGNIVVSAALQVRTFSGLDGTMTANTALPSQIEEVVTFPLSALLLERDGDEVIASPGTTLWRLDDDLSVLGIDEIDYGRADTSVNMTNFVLQDDGRPQIALLESGQITIGTISDDSSSNRLRTTGANEVTDFALSPSGGLAVVASSDGLVLVSLDGRQLLAKAFPHFGVQNAILSSSGNRSLVGAPISSVPVRMWDLAGETPSEIELPSEIQEPFGWFDVRSDDVFTVMAFDGTTRFFDTSTLDQVDLATNVSFGTSFSPDGSLYVAGRDFNVTGAGPEFEVFRRPDYTSVAIVDLTPWSGWEPDQTDPVYIRKSAFNRDASRLAMSFGNGTTVVFDTSNWQPVATIEPSAEGQGGATTVEYSADGRYLATRDLEGNIDMRDPVTNEIIFTLASDLGTNEAQSYGPYFSDDGRYLLTTRDGNPRLWDVDAREVVGSFPSDDGSIPEGNSGEHARLVTAIGDYFLSWNLDVDEWAKLACRAAGRNMTQDEWDRLGPQDQPYAATCEQWPTSGGQGS